MLTKKTLFLEKVTLTAIILCGGYSPRAQAADLNKILQSNFAVSKVADSVSDATMTLINAEGQSRVRKTDGKTKLKKGTLDNQRLVHFQSPSDVKDMVTLTIENSKSGEDDDIRVYLPALKKVKRLIASNKKDSYAGTDFSYGDVIGHRVADWNHRILKEETLDGKPCYVIESLPKTPKIKADSGYSKRVTWVAKDNLVSIQAHLYDTDGKMIKVIRLSKYENVDPAHGKWVPMKMEAENVQTHHKTVIESSNYHANQGLSDDEFTPRALEQAS